VKALDFLSGALECTTVISRKVKVDVYPNGVEDERSRRSANNYSTGSEKLHDEKLKDSSSLSAPIESSVLHSPSRKDDVSTPEKDGEELFVLTFTYEVLVIQSGARSYHIMKHYGDLIRRGLGILRKTEAASSNDTHPKPPSDTEGGFSNGGYLLMPDGDEMEEEG